MLIELTLIYNLGTQEDHPSIKLGVFFLLFIFTFLDLIV